MTILNILKELLLIGTIINLSKAEIDSSKTDAFSQFRFVEYQPIPPEKLRPSLNSDPTRFKNLDEETEYFGHPIERPKIQQNSETNNDNQVLPKNYAFSYAIRDRNSGDDFSHTQAHNGQATKGEYRVKLPDGRIQVVTYTADNGGYKADIRYDNDALQESSNTGIYVSEGFPKNFPQPLNTANLAKNSFITNPFKDNVSNKKVSDKLSNSQLFNFNDIKSFDNPSSKRKTSSYETTESIDEELFPYSKKLLDDVNYLLKFVSPTLESKHEKSKIFVDFSKSKFLNEEPYFKEKFKDESLHKDKFQLPANFPYKFSKFEEPKFEKLTFNEPNFDDHTFIEPSLMRPKDHKFLEFNSGFGKEENEKIKNQPHNGIENFKFNRPVFDEKYFNLKHDAPKFEKHPSFNSNFDDNKLKYSGSRGNKGSQFERLNFDDVKNIAQKSEESRYNLLTPNGLKFDNSRLNKQNSEIGLPKKFNNDLPAFDPKTFENDHSEQFINEKPKLESAHFENSNYNILPDSNDVKFPTLPEDKQNFEYNTQSNPTNVEIPQYIHIHRYEESGEDQNGNGRPKELVYYNPLQIPVPNSMTYMEQGTYNFSNPQHSVLTPTYITMTEHPRIQQTNSQPYYDSTKFANISDPGENFLKPIPSQPISSELTDNFENTYNDNTQQIRPPQSTSAPETSAPPQTNHNNYENTIGNLPPLFDARTYSGYFDFLSSSEVESNDEKGSPPEISDPSTPDYTKEDKKELPQFYYDFSTATPSHKYVSSAESSPEQSQSFDSDQIRNITFLASANLRPLHKERVYIYHNSLPTTPDENYSFSSTTSEPKQNRQNEADVQIIKSISSTIPPELLKDFDHQLSSSIFQKKSDIIDSADSERKEIKISTEPSEKLNQEIIKKLRSTLSVNSDLYLKTPTQQSRVSR